MTRSALYSKLWRIADHIIRENNPCQIEVRDGVASCTRTRKDTQYYESTPGCLCCGGCQHLGPQGCTTESLGCKLGGCGNIAQLPLYAPNANVTNTSLRMLASVAEANGFRLWTSVRRSKQDYFEIERKDEAYA